MLHHRIYKKALSGILFSDVQGGGLNAYRTWKIRIALSVAVRLGWIEKGWITHFEKTLWQDAKLIIEQGEWTGTIADLMAYRFWIFFTDKARDIYTELGVKFRKDPDNEKYKHDNLIWATSDKIAEEAEKRRATTPWERELHKAKVA